MPRNILVHSQSRRAWIQRSAATLAVLFAGSPLRAKESPLSSAIASMYAVTGSHLGEEWQVPVTALVNVILDDSKPLRALQLGSIEMATRFTAG